jgi:hypothetical protein
MAYWPEAIVYAQAHEVDLGEPQLRRGGAAPRPSIGGRCAQGEIEIAGACLAGTRVASDVPGGVDEWLPSLTGIWPPESFSWRMHASPPAVNLHRITESAQFTSGWKHEDQTDSR